MEDNTTTETISSVEEIPVPEELSADKMMTENLLLIGLLFFIFYFVMIRPQQKRYKVHQEMMKSLQRGQEILTMGGVIGKIVKFEGDSIVHIEVSPDVKLRVARSSVQEVLDKKDSPAANDA